MAQEVRVSVIIPVFNGESFVRHSVESALAQDYRDYEILVVDDGSTDGTRAVLDSFGPKIKMLSQPNRGAYAARNLALREARGEFIAFLDADDAWLPSKLSKQLPALESDPELGLVFADGVILEDQMPGRSSSFFALGKPFRGHVFAELVKRNFIPQSSVLVRKKCFEETGPFREVSLGADYHKWLQISLRYKLDYLDEPLFTYTVHAQNSSRDLMGRYRLLLALFDDLILSTKSPEPLALLRKRRVELEYEFALIQSREGLKRLWRTTVKPVEGVGAWRRFGCLASLLGSRAANSVRKAKNLIRSSGAQRS